jgi:crossover junction endodeoxyribonuclease RuvC
VTFSANGEGSLTLLGLDPGLATVGFGVLTLNPAKRLVLKSQWGIITTTPQGSTPQRLAEIYADTLHLLQQVKPTHIAIEQLFYFRNITTALPVAQARGVLLLACQQWQMDIPLAEYTPMQVKQALTGYGKATKGEMQTAVQARLSLDELPKPDDAADGLAIALCHAQFTGWL